MRSLWSLKEECCCLWSRLGLVGKTCSSYSWAVGLQSFSPGTSERRYGQYQGVDVTYLGTLSDPEGIIEILGNPLSDLQLWLTARHCCLRMKNACKAWRGKVNVILKLEISILSNEMPCYLIPFTGVRLYIKASWVLNYMSGIILHCGHEMWDCPLREKKNSSAQSGWLIVSSLA